jgi:hypothetical protein
MATGECVLLMLVLVLVLLLLPLLAAELLLVLVLLMLPALSVWLPLSVLAATVLLASGSFGAWGKLVWISCTAAAGMARPLGAVVAGSGSCCELETLSDDVLSASSPAALVAGASSSVASQLKPQWMSSSSSLQLPQAQLCPQLKLRAAAAGVSCRPKSEGGEAKQGLVHMRGWPCGCAGMAAEACHCR